MKLGSLFDGIGGWQLAAINAGIEPVWSSEIETFPLEVTKRRFPKTKQLGDVTKINGAEIEPCDIITSGSPCQDFSVANAERNGLDGTRSGLWFHADRIIRQMRLSTGGLYPRFYILENVPGILSSNQGMDFRTILATLTDTEIPIPRSGKWANAGMVRSRRCDVGWRILDAQYLRSTQGNFMLPQRRRRLWLVADFAESHRCAEKILFECEGLSGDTEPSRKTRERPASNIEKSFATTDRITNRGGSAFLKIRSGLDDGNAGKGALIGMDASFTLGCNNDQTLFQERKNDTVKNKDGIITYNVHKTVKVRKHEVDVDGLKQLLKDSLKSSGLSKKDIAEKLDVPQTQVDHYFRQDKYFSIPDADVWLMLKEMLGITTDEFDEQIMEFEEKECNFDSANRIYDVGGVSPTLTSVDTDKTILQPITLYDMHHAQDVIREYKDVSPSMLARMGTGGNNVPILTENIPEVYCIGHDERSAQCKQKVMVVQV